MIQRKCKTLLYLSCLLLMCGSLAIAAARNGRTPDGTTLSPAAAAREKMRQQAQQSHQMIKALLTQVLELVRQNERPSAEVVDRCRVALEDNKQNALAYEDSQRADYMLLQAWTGFFQGNMPEALNWSMRACRQYEAGQDAWISQACFNMLNGKRPLEPHIEKPKPETQRSRPAPYRPRRNAEMTAEAPKADPYSEKGTLDFDIFALRSEFFRERFERLQCTTAGGRPFEYVPGQDMLCVLFFQTEQELDEQLQQPADMVQDVFGSTATAEIGYVEAAGAPGLDLDTQRQYFQNLIENFRGSEAVKFLQVDTVRPRDLQSVNPADYAAGQIPTVIPSDPASNARRFACDAQRPFMMIIDKEGSVRYSGPAGYFMPAFILSETTGQKIKLQAGSGISFSPDDFGFAPSDPNRPAVDPNAPPAAPQTTGPAPSSPFGSETDMPFEETEQQLSAENLLRMAQLEIEQSIKVRGSNPEEGIKACREVLAKYPNTPFADQARQLLRRVPDRYKERYNITDEELGL